MKPLEKDQPIVLVDVSKSGKSHWEPRKQESRKLSDKVDIIGNESGLLSYKRKAVRIGQCGDWLIFNECPQGHYKKLRRANFCKERLCPMCQWRKSLYVFGQFNQIAHEALKDNPTHKFLMLTLTDRNVPADELSDRITHYMKSWERLSRKKAFKDRIKGWFRTLEVTYNPDRNDYHPHFHAILEVPSNYFTINYLSQAKWIELWKQAARLDYDPNVDIRKVRKKRKGIPTIQEDIDLELKKQALAAAGAEVAKYSVKVSDILDYPNATEVIYTLSEALKNRQLVAYGGHFREIYRRLKQQDVETAGLIHMPGEKRCQDTQCPICNSEMSQTHYTWNEYIRKFLKVDRMYRGKARKVG